MSPFINFQKLIFANLQSDGQHFFFTAEDIIALPIVDRILFFKPKIKILIVYFPYY